LNRQQKIVLGGAFVNVASLMLFPPCDAISLAGGAPSFDAFYPVFAIPPQRVISANLLYYALIAVAANAAAAWLLLSGGKAGKPRVDPGTLVVAMSFLNLMIVFLFPPYATQPGVGAGSFQGFEFALGGGARRSIFVPLLYLEVIFVLINACAFWLALRERSATQAVDESLERLIGEKQEFEDRVKLGVEERIREEAKKAGRAAAQAKRPGQ